MNAIAQIHPEADESRDPFLVSAAVEACAESLAIIEGDRVLYSNPAFARLFDLPISEMRGRALADLVPELGPSAHTARASAGDGGESSLIVGEFSSPRKDGTLLHIKASCAAFRTRGRDLVVVSARDAGHSQLTEEQMREAHRMEAIGRMVSGVAHDFNNLLTGMVLCCDLLLASLEKDSRLRRYAEEIRMAGAQGAALIQQLLAVARQRVVEPRLLSWNEVIHAIRNLLTRLIGENIELVMELTERLGFVEMDPAQVQQIILNLVLNARDALPDGGRVTLRTRNFEERIATTGEQKCYIEFTVSDTGCGMDAETCAHIFEPFFTTKKSGKGNGLGLATVSRIVKHYGGTIDVDSAPASGTRVIVRLPRIEAPTGKVLR